MIGVDHVHQQVVVILMCLIDITIKQVYIFKKKVYLYLRQKSTHDCPSFREPGGQAESLQNVDILVNLHKQSN